MDRGVEIRAGGGQGGGRREEGGRRWEEGGERKEEGGREGGREGGGRVPPVVFDRNSISVLG